MYSVDRLQGLFGLQLADPLEGQISGISPRHNVLVQQPFLDHFDRPLKLPDHTLSEERWSLAKTAWICFRPLTHRTRQSSNLRNPSSYGGLRSQDLPKGARSAERKTAVLYHRTEA
jgi:hypothetical protein